MSKIAFATFEGPVAVRRAVDSLVTCGASPADITISATDAEVRRHITGGETDEGPSTDSSPLPGASAGAAAGSLAGAALGMVPAALLFPAAIPTFLLLSLGGAAAGALGGTVAGAILGTGYELQEQAVIEKELQEGRILVTVRSDDESASVLEAALIQAGGRMAHQPAASA